MTRKWFVVSVLLALTWGTANSAAADKVKHFKDDQGTVHITNVKPEDQAKGAPETSASGPIKLRVPEPKPPGGAFPPGGEAVEAPPEEAPEAPEPPQAEEPAEEEGQPDEGG